MTVDYTKLGAAIGGAVVIILQAINVTQSGRIEILDDSILQTETNLNRQILELSQKMSQVQDRQNAIYHDQLGLVQAKLDAIQKKLGTETNH